MIRRQHRGLEALFQNPQSGGPSTDPDQHLFIGGTNNVRVPLVKRCARLARQGGLPNDLLDEGVRAIPRKSRVIVLDFDATDDPIHSNQEDRFFHGYYREYCYLPLYCFCRDDIMTWIEKQPAVHYVLGLARNKRLQALLAPEFENVRAAHAAACELARCEGRDEPRSSRCFSELQYRTQKSWSRTRRVMGWNGAVLSRISVI